VTGLPHRNVELRRAQFTATLSSDVTRAIARSIVEQKIRNQRTLLRRNHESRPDLALRRMRELIDSCRTAESLGSLLGIEGTAARVFFNHFPAMLRNPQLAFDMRGRNRRPPTDPVNALLSFAQPGTLSPSSSTSVTWQSQWPNKPDIVVEGGNAARNPATGEAAPLDDLTLLTTDSQITRRLLVPTWATSAATAQAARLGATLMARYPSFWPETIRALLVHSARWTDAMRSEFAAMTPARRREVLLRRYGYGVPDIERASWSASNRLTLIAEESLQPYGEPRGSHVPTKDLQVYELPWPKEQLQALPSATQVTLRATLSYFIEPNPARRGWKYKHRYQSHGLRFAMQNALEPLDEFRSRISRDLQVADGELPDFGEPGWALAHDRNRGSIHSDWWTGPAADLAQREHLCVFPVGGWWKERRSLGYWSKSVRYALIVSIETPITGVDIYTPVANRVGVPAAIVV